VYAFELMLIFSGAVMKAFNPQVCIHSSAFTISNLFRIGCAHELELLQKL